MLVFEEGGDLQTEAVHVATLDHSPFVGVGLVAKAKLVGVAVALEGKDSWLASLVDVAKGAVEVVQHHDVAG